LPDATGRHDLTRAGRKPGISTKEKNVAYHYLRNEIDTTIEMLAMKYPKCFFADHRMRLPLKKNIEADLETDGAKIDPYLLTQTLEWYQSSWGYLYAVIGGKPRIDLNGKEVASVTQQERAAAEKKLAESKRADALKRQSYSSHSSGASNGRLPPAVLPRVPESINPALSIISGFKELKKKLHTESEELAARMREIFPAELVELFPDLERSISKMMEGATEVIEYCSGKKVT
jgi:sRNA-binding protein